MTQLNDTYMRQQHPVHYINHISHNSACRNRINMEIMFNTLHTLIIKKEDALFKTTKVALGDITLIKVTGRLSIKLVITAFYINRFYYYHSVLESWLS